MNRADLGKSVVLYTGVLGGLTVGAVYLATRSLLAILLLIGGGLLLAVLNGGSAGRTSLGGAERADEGGLEAESRSVLPSSTELPLQFVLLLYGLGLALWGLVVLVTLRETLA